MGLSNCLDRLGSIGSRLVCLLIARLAEGDVPMASERVQRKLTTILAADVEGYSRLMGADEEATLKTLKT